MHVTPTAPKVRSEIRDMKEVMGQSRPLVELLQELRAFLNVRSRFPSIVLVICDYLRLLDESNRQLVNLLAR